RSLRSSLPGANRSERAWARSTAVARLYLTPLRKSDISSPCGSAREFVRAWPAKTERAKDAGRLAPGARSAVADRGCRHATVCSRAGTQRNVRAGPRVKAVVFHEFGGPDVLQLEDVEAP